MEFVNSIFKLITASCTCADVSDFKLRNVKISLLNIFDRSVKTKSKNSEILYIKTIFRLKFNEVECTERTDE